ncbi:hypothetical protein ACKU27_11995 [Sphingobium yanoikuyae]|uniref:hypothetical protein n=1 Tax=Sphingobium yanoikuyae TaxID=13690 RepID=UPI003B8FD5E7
MGVTNTNAYDGPFYPNGVTTSFPFTFRTMSTSEVIIVDRQGAQITGFSFSILPAVGADGGSIVFDSAPTAAALPEFLIASAPNFGVGIDLGSVTAFNPRTLNPSFERLAAQNIFLKDRVERSPQTPLGGGAENQFPVVKPDGSWGFSGGTGNDPALRQDLSMPGAGKGADLVRFDQATPYLAGTSAARLQEVVSVRDKLFGAKGDAVDDTAAFLNIADFLANEAVKGRTRLMEIPAVELGYRLKEPFKPEILFAMRGQGIVPYRGNNGPSGTQGGGSWIEIDHDGTGLDFGNGIPSSGLEISGIGIRRPFQTPPGSSAWEPIDHGYDIALNSVDARLSNIMFLGSARGIRAYNGNYGRLTAENIFGHFFKEGINLDKQYDLPIINNFRAWSYWAGNSHVSDYTLENLNTIVLGRVDNPILHNIFSIAHAKGILIDRTNDEGEYPGGSVSKGKFTNIDMDAGTVGLYVSPNVVTCDIDIANMSIQGGSADAVSHGIQIEGDNARIGVTHFDARNFKGSAIRCVGVNGNAITVSGRVLVAGFNNEPASSYPAFEIDNDNTINVTTWPVIESGAAGAADYGGGGTFNTLEAFGGDLSALNDAIAAKAGTSDLASSTNAAKGAGQVGFNRNRPYSGNTIAAYVKQTVLTISPLMTEFAGGAPMNGVDDAAAAMRACLAYAKTTTTRYDGTCVQIMLPNGKLRLDSAHPSFADRALDITGCDHVSIHGLGMGNSTLALNGNFAALKGDDAAGTPLLGFTMKNLLILGPGRSNVNAHAIMMGGNNSCRIEDVRAWSCRTYLDYRDAWQLEVIRPRCDGQGDLACYDGLFGRDGTAGLAECVVDVQGGQLAYVERYGWRAENPTGIKGFGTEILACGAIGVYWGDSPSGKAFKWVTYNDMIVDTCPDLVVLRAGTASYVKENQIHFKWLGYASEPLPGEGIGLDVSGMKDSAFTVDKITNVQYGVKLSGCDGIVARLGQISDYDRLLTGGAAIICENTIGSTFDVGRTRKAASSPSTVAFVESGTSNNNRVTGLFDGAVNTVGAGTDKTGAKVI